MEKGNFERSWKEAFEGAEVAPSNSVWTNVELDLEKAASGKMKQRLLFYKLMAAASLIFAMSVAGVYYWSAPGNGSDYAQIKEGAEIIPSLPNESEASTQQGTVVAEETPGKSKASSNSTSGTKGDVKNTRYGNTSKPLITATNNQTPINTFSGVPATSESNPGLLNQGDYADRFAATPKTKLVTLKEPALLFPAQQSNADPGMVLLARLKDKEKKYQEKEKRVPSENIWTSVGFAAGSFNPNSPQSTMLQNSSLGNSYSSYSNNPSSGSSYSIGIQVGGRIANRLVLLGGVSYLTQNASYTSNTASLESTAVKASLNDQAFSGDNQAITVSPYSVNSNLQYVSLPVQAGYVIVDQKFAIQLNGGVSTDFFLLNTLTPESDNIDKVTQGSGDESPYRPVTFSGLVGTEFSYRFSDRYRVSLNPGLRYALNSIYKSDVSAEVSPITYDVALRFRYIFK